jgi:hypothetical protein
MVVVTGPTTCDALEQVLARHGLEAAIASAPQDWQAERPADWPKEPLIPSCANECVVRVSAIVARSVRLARDQPIEDGAVFTVHAAWDYGPAPAPASREHTGAAATAPPTPAAAATATGNNNGQLIKASLLVAFGFGLWSFMSSRRKEEAEEERLALAAARAHRDELLARAEHYFKQGESEQEAQAHAERDMASRELAMLEEAC